MNPLDPRLTEREQLVMQTLMAQRDVYKSNGHPVAAHAVGVALWLVWQVFLRIDEEPKP
jgi:hypothetical protein